MRGSKISIDQLLDVIQSSFRGFQKEVGDTPLDISIKHFMDDYAKCIISTCHINDTFIADLTNIVINAFSKAFIITNNNIYYFCEDSFFINLNKLIQVGANKNNNVFKASKNTNIEDIIKNVNLPFKLIDIDWEDYLRNEINYITFYPLASNWENKERKKTNKWIQTYSELRLWDDSTSGDYVTCVPTNMTKNQSILLADNLIQESLISNSDRDQLVFLFTQSKIEVLQIMYPIKWLGSLKSLCYLIFALSNSKLIMDFNWADYLRLTKTFVDKNGLIIEQNQYHNHKNKILTKPTNNDNKIKYCIDLLMTKLKKRDF